MDKHPVNHLGTEAETMYPAQTGKEASPSLASVYKDAYSELFTKADARLMPQLSAYLRVGENLRGNGVFYDAGRGIVIDSYMAENEETGLVPVIMLHRASPDDIRAYGDLDNIYLDQLCNDWPLEKSDSEGVLCYAGSSMPSALSYVLACGLQDGTVIDAGSLTITELVEELDALEAEALVAESCDCAEELNHDLDGRVAQPLSLDMLPEELR